MTVLLTLWPRIFQQLFSSQRGLYMWPWLPRLARYATYLRRLQFARHSAFSGPQPVRLRRLLRALRRLHCKTAKRRDREVPGWHFTRLKRYCFLPISVTSLADPRGVRQTSSSQRKRREKMPRSTSLSEAGAVSLMMPCSAIQFLGWPNRAFLEE